MVSYNFESGNRALFWSNMFLFGICEPIKTGWPGSVSVRLRFGGRTVQAVPVFGSGGSSAKRFFLCFSTV